MKLIQIMPFKRLQRQRRPRCWHKQTSYSLYRPAGENQPCADVARRSGILFLRSENLWVTQTSDKSETDRKINHSENAPQMPVPEKSETWDEFLESSKKERNNSSLNVVHSHAGTVTLCVCECVSVYLFCLPKLHLIWLTYSESH